MSRKLTKIEKLLNRMERDGGMTHKECVEFLLRDTGKEYSRENRKIFDSTLYGDSLREGVFYRFAKRLVDGRWKIRRGVKITAPFNPVRIYATATPETTSRKNTRG